MSTPHRGNKYAELLRHGEQAIQQREFGRAEKIYDWLMTNFPEEIAPHLWRLELYLLKKNYKQALQLMLTPTLKRAEPAWYTEKLVFILYKLGMDEEARKLSGTRPLSEWAICHEILATKISPEQIDEFIDKQAMDNKHKSICKKYMKIMGVFRDNLKNIDFSMISLGQACFPGRFISKWGFGAKVTETERRYPFDLGRGNPEHILDIINSDFKQMKSVENIIIENECPRLADIEYRFKHDKIADYNFDTSIFLNSLLKRIKNFDNAVLKENILFLMIDDCVTPEKIEKANLFLGRYNGRHKLLCIDRGEKFTNYEIYVDRDVFILPSPSKSMDNWNHPNHILSEDGYVTEVQISLAIKKIAEENFPRKSAASKLAECQDLASKERRLEISEKYNVREYLKNIHSSLKNTITEESINGAIVMNCNPFTLGHRYLIATAAKQVDKLLIFVVEEDKSQFSFTDRFEMVINGTKDIKNVCVVKSGKFIISTLTFPDYFNKEDTSELDFDVSSDLHFFGEFIAPNLKIKKRFVGTEPTCAVTKKYNEEMHSLLPRYGIDVIEIKRKEFSGTPISASIVRRCMRSGDHRLLEKLLPETTMKILSRGRCKPPLSGRLREL